MRIRRILATLGAVAVTAVAAAPVAAANPPPPKVPGMVITESTRSFDETWSVLLDRLEANPNIGVVATIDHAAAAASVGLDLSPNRLVVFGNPRIGTPVMVESSTAGLDLPLKMLVWQERGRVFVGSNSVDYLAARHRLSASPALDAAAGALHALAEAATGTAVDDGRIHGLRRYRPRSGLVSRTSDSGAAETLDRLVAAIEALPANVAFTVDHAAGAASVGMDLAPNTVVVLGNPRLGTPLMQAAPTAGVDLPLKMLVWEDGQGTAHVTYTDIEALDQRHHFRGQSALRKTIAQALANLAATAG